MVLSSGTQVLMFHRVMTDVQAAFGLPNCYRIRGTAWTENEFEHFIQGCVDNIPLDKIELALEETSKIPLGTVITFDDGYKEHKDIVCPILQKYGCTATFYVATGIHASSHKTAPVDAWYWLLDHAIHPNIEIRFPSGNRYTSSLDCLEDKIQWVQGAPKKDFLEACVSEQQEIISLLEKVVQTTLPHDLNEQLYLHPNDWKYLVDQGMRIGAHSISHPRLSQISACERKKEIDCSIDTIEKLCSSVTFAYPDGAYDEAVVAYMKTTRARSSVTCVQGLIQKTTSLHQIPRIFMKPPYGVV